MSFRIISERGYLRHSLYFYDTPRSSHRSVEKEDFVRFLSVPMMHGRYSAGHGDDDGGTVETVGSGGAGRPDRSAEHTSELQSLMRIAYAVFCMKNKNHQ